MPEVYPRNQPELEKQFENEADCRSYLETLRWPDGYRCPKCAGSACWRRKMGLIECLGWGYETSVIAGTVFQDTKLPLKTWFRAMWLMAGQKSGMSALTLQRDLGLGSYKTAWSMLHKMRLAMVRPGRERLSGNVEVDETYSGAAESGGAVGRLTHSKSLIAVAAQCDGAGIGRIRLARIPDTSRATLHQFIAESIEPGSTVITDGLHAYRQLEGYHHERLIQRREASDVHLLPRVHRGWCLCSSDGCWELTKGPFPMLTSIPISESSPFASIAGRPLPGANYFIDLPNRQFKSARPYFPTLLNHKIWDYRSHVNSPINVCDIAHRKL